MGTQQELREAFGDFARRWDGQWSYFATLTFQNQKTTAAGARACLKRFLNRVPRALAPAILLWGMENQKRGTPHFHVLWANYLSMQPGDWRFLKELWHESYGIARFFPYRINLGAAYYVGKYLFKEQMYDWGIWHLGMEFREGKAS